VTGTVHVLPFAATGDDPEQAALRVLTAALGSLGPNTIVIDIDTDAGTLYAHQLVSGDPVAAAMPLGGT
jgi:multisubunit Na+/H+ antiporter MnhE subunit